MRHILYNVQHTNVIKTNTIPIQNDKDSNSRSASQISDHAEGQGCLHIIEVTWAINWLHKNQIQLEFPGSRLMRSLYSQNTQRGPPLGECQEVL